MSQINESTIKTPGVYVNEIPSFPPAIAQVATAVPVFIGYTQMAQSTNGKDLTNKPTRITSLLEYELYFGGGQPETGIVVTYTQQDSGDAVKVEFKSARSQHNMHNAIRLFYANGGGACYITSVGGFKANIGDAPTKDDMEKGLDAVRMEDEPTLIVFPEGQNMDETEYYALIGDALKQCHDLQDRFCIIDSHDTGEALKTSGDLAIAIGAFRTKLTTNDPNYGAAYYPNVKTVYHYDYDETKTVINYTVNGTKSPLDGKFLSDFKDPKTGNSAAYSVLKQALNTQFSVVLPPSPAMAGVYAAVDGTRGVWKAPANVGLLDVSGTVFPVSDDMQADMNVDATSGKSVNAIRAFTGKGILVWGARTLDGNSNDFRYISVRRFFIMVEESVKKAAAQFVFEPNDGNTWVRIRAMIENYLTNLWRLGALAGSKPEQAFYVKVGLGQTMTFDDILNGKMIVEIGMAPVRPAEFIILRFSQIQQQA